MGSLHDRSNGRDHDGRDAQERYDDEHWEPWERDLLRGGESGYHWHLLDLYREDLDARAEVERTRRWIELMGRASRDEYPIHNETWWDDVQRARQRPDLRRIVQKSIDFDDGERERMRRLVGATREEWDAVAGRRSRATRTRAERERYAGLGRRVDAAVAARGPGGVKLVCEAYSTNRVTVSRLRRAARSFTG